MVIYIYMSELCVCFFQFFVSPLPYPPPRLPPWGRAHRYGFCCTLQHQIFGRACLLCDCQMAITEKTCPPWEHMPSGMSPQKWCRKGTAKSIPMGSAPRRLKGRWFHTHPRSPPSSSLSLLSLSLLLSLFLLYSLVIPMGSAPRRLKGR